MEWNLFVAYLISNASKNIYNQEMCYINFFAKQHICSNLTPSWLFQRSKDNTQHEKLVLPQNMSKKFLSSFHGWNNEVQDWKMTIQELHVATMVTLTYFDKLQL